MNGWKAPLLKTEANPVTSLALIRALVVPVGRRSWKVKLPLLSVSTCKPW